MGKQCQVCSIFAERSYLVPTLTFFSFFFGAPAPPGVDPIIGSAGTDPNSRSRPIKGLDPTDPSATITLDIGVSGFSTCIMYLNDNNTRFRRFARWRILFLSFHLYYPKHYRGLKRGLSTYHLHVCIFSDNLDT